jgi:hypothetical protein
MFGRGASFLSLALLAAAFAGGPPTDQTAVALDADFPGGNIVLEKIEGDTVSLHQDLRDTTDWFYWSFRVRGAAGRTLEFRFTRGDVLGERGPAVSTDGGKTWDWLGRETVRGASFRYTFPASAPEVRLAFCIPYLEQNLREFLGRQISNPHLKTGTLCRSRKGRNVELLHAGRLDGKCEHRVLLTCRHHACETMASYALEGLLGAVLADTHEGRWFRDHVELLAVPFMDKDGVEDGDQGKRRRPHDHWEDYAGVSRYPEVEALRKLVPAWSGGQLHVALDLHCPARRDRTLYFAGPRRQELAQHLARFSAALESLPGSPLAYRAAGNMAFDTGWNTAAYYGPRKSFALWAEEIREVRLVATLEIPYADVDGKAVTPDTARAFGKQLASPLRRCLETRP